MHSFLDGGSAVTYSIDDTYDTDKHDSYRNVMSPKKGDSMPSTQRNVPINEEMLKKALQKRDMSKYRLFKILEDMKDDHGKTLITARSAQRALKRGTISLNVRDQIARLLNVAPEYLEGKWINGNDDNPDHYPYLLHNSSGINEDEAFQKFFDSILTDWGFTTEKLTDDEYSEVIFQTIEVLESFAWNVLLNRDDPNALKRWRDTYNAARLNIALTLGQEERNHGKKED